MRGQHLGNRRTKSKPLPKRQHGHQGGARALLLHTHRVTTEVAVRIRRVVLTLEQVKVGDAFANESVHLDPRLADTEDGLERVAAVWGRRRGG